MLGQNRVTKLVLGFFIVALPAATLVTVLKAPHASMVFSHYLKGSTGNCSLAESFEAGALSRLQVRNDAEIRGASRVIRRDGRFSLWSTPSGEYWMPAASGDALICDLAEQKRNIYGDLIRPGDIVLDAGANVGVFTRKALRGGAGKVVAIEPAPENLECLRRNFAPEIAEGRVVIYPKGIWDKDDVLELNVDPANSARDSFVRRNGAAQFIEVPLTTVDRMVDELRLREVNFIKMDIEGAEPKAVAGAKNTIAAFRPRMALSVYHFPGDETLVLKLVHAAVPGYTVTRSCLCVADRIGAQVAFFQ